MLKIQVAVSDPLALERDALIVALAEDERRLRGIAAKADKKLNEQLKKLREWGKGVCSKSQSFLPMLRALARS